MGNMDKENPPARTTNPRMKEPKFNWDLGPSGGAKTGEVPKVVPRVSEGSHSPRFRVKKGFQRK